MAQKKENHRDEQQDMRGDDGNETAGAEFVPVLEDFQATKQAAAAVDAFKSVVIGGSAALIGEGGVEGIDAFVAGGAQEIVE